MSEMKNSAAVCIDANLIVWSLIPQTQSSTVLALLRAWEDEQVRLLAPALLSFEVTSALRR